MTSELKSMFGENISDQNNQSQNNSQKEVEKKTKDYLKKQTSMKRELIKLIGGVPSIVERTANKGEKKNTNWIWTSFTNPARSDNLKLTHWQRADDNNKDYEFSKLNNNVDIVEFTKEEYDNLIKPNDRNWNYEQTCYLWDLIKRYELRFIVIMDRFDEEKYGERTVESLKDRYYSVARIILENRKMFDHPIIKSGYNYEQEMKRRIYLEKTMNKSFADLREENNLLEMAENLNKKMEKNEKFEDAIHQKLKELKIQTSSSANQINSEGNNNTIQIPMTIEETEKSTYGYYENKNININQINSNENTINSNLNQINRVNFEPLSLFNNGGQTFEDFIKNNVTRNDSFVYLRSQKLKHNLPVSEKVQERIDNIMKEFNIQQKLIPTEKVEIAYDNLRNNIILYTSLKKFLEKKDKEFLFLQSKFKEYQNKKNPPNPQGINNGPNSHQPQNKSNLKSEKNPTQFSKTNQKTIGQNEIKDQEMSQETTINKNTNINSTNQNINNINKTNNISGTNSIVNSVNTEMNNNVNNNNINNQESNKQPGPKEKKRKITATPKARKRKNINEDEAPNNEEKEQKSNSKKKKKGTK